jgi:hypothetical protein
MLVFADQMELETDAKFEYFFLENDSIDNTPSILKKWMKNKNGLLSCENFNSKKFGSTLDSERMLLMSNLRNKMSALDSKKDSDYSVIFDSDVIFEPNIINQFLLYLDLNFSLLTSNIRQNVPCKMGSGSLDSYYDSSILFDSDGINCMTWSDNPFYNDKDRENFKNNLPVKVKSAFGSFAFLPTKYLSQTSWQSKGESEHLSWCYQLNKIAPIFLIPSIKPRVEIEQKTWDHEDRVIKQQKHLLENKWNRFLLKTKSR